jgi:hypothetical protein
MTGRSAAPDRRWRNLPLARERDVRGHRWMWILLSACVLSFSPFAVYLLEQMQHVQLRYRVENLRAKDELGLVHPASNQRVVILPSATGRGGLMARGPDREGDVR